jgi:hypothetical protein
MMNATNLIPDQHAAEVMLTAALGQIEWARQYTLELLDATPRELWFERPRLMVADSETRLPTHIAWQVGHLAVSQYGLLMFRIHGRRDEDLDLIPSRFRKAYARGSDPAAPASSQCSADELLDRLATVHHRAITGLTSGFNSRTLLEPVEMPFAVYPIKLGAVLFCPLHEQIHSGHIGVIRRCLALPPLR